MNKLKNIFLFLLIFIFLINNFIFTAPRHVKVQINSNPQGVTVYVKGMPASIGTTPLISQFTIGRRYTLTFTKTGYQDKTINYFCDGNPIFVNMEGGSFDTRQYKLTVNSNINGANIFANDNKIGNTPLTARLQAGTYNIRVTNPGYTDYTTSVNLDRNQQIYANLQPIILQYRLTVNSNINGASVYINENKIGNTPLSTMLQAGTYNVRVSHPGYTDYNSTINLNENKQIYANLQAMKHKLTINSNVNNASVYLNSNKVGNIPYSTFLSPGTYNILVRHHGYKDFNTTVNLMSDQTIYANLESYFGISINLPKGAQLYINGEKQNLNWSEHEFWKVFYFTSFKEFNQVKIRYHGIDVEKSIKFDNRTVSLIFDIN
ncbi:MAG: PEGA domain-containing protein [Spirochaetes bacterium]|nr:PEGA domain-containing protein [Spirochaetota bacterium]